MTAQNDKIAFTARKKGNAENFLKQIYKNFDIPPFIDSGDSWTDMLNIRDVFIRDKKVSKVCYCVFITLILDTDFQCS